MKHYFSLDDKSSFFLRLIHRMHLDWCLLFLLLLICVVGMFILYSASGKDLSLVFRQAKSFVIGFVCLLIVAQINPRLWLGFTPFVYVTGVMLLIAVDVMGHNAMGATRWINIAGVFRFQPAELMKVIMPVTVAWYLGKRPLPVRFRYVVISLVIIMIPVILVIRQPDLGTSLLILAAGIFVLFIAGLNWYLIGISLVLLIPSIFGMWHFVMHDYQKQRVLTFLNPESDPLGSGWNIIQSKTAIGSGGIWGKGYLNSTQSHLDFLPESHTDFIVAVFAEEFGLIGMLVIMLIYMLIIWRTLVIAINAEQLFGKLLISGLALTFFIYLFVNIGMVSGLLPVVGVPLPFVSYGGTHVVTLLVSFGLIMAIHTHRDDFNI